MVLLYKFKYNSNNNTYKNFLFNIANRSNLPFSITLKDDFISLYVESNEENLKSFSDNLSSNLPMSIFMTSENVEVVETMPKNEVTSIVSDESILPFCPTCLKSIDDINSKFFYNPFINCDLCGQDIEGNNLILINEDEKLESKNYKELFEKTAKLINNGKKVKVKTFGGEFVFGTLNENLSPEIQSSLKLMLTDINSIGKFVIAQKSEIVALASIEKPSIDLKQNMIFKSKNFIENDEVNVRICNDFITYLLSKELLKLGVEIVYYVDCENSTSDASLTFNTNESFREISIPKVVALENGKLLPLKNKNYNNKLSVMYSKFDDSDKSQFITVLEENSLFETKAVNLYCSKLANDKFSYYSEDIGGFNDLLSFKCPSSMKEVFEVLSSTDGGARLVNNYKEKFPEVYDSIQDLNFVGLKDNLFSLWTIASLVLGFDKNITTAGDTLINNALAFKPDKGPRIDYYKKDSEKNLGNMFEFSRLIKSGMSFKLAGVEDNTISYGYIESFSHFISREVENINDELAIDAVSISGSLFGINLVTNLVEKELSNNFKLYYNKDFPIDAISEKSIANC